MFRNRVDGPQLQSSGIAVKGTAENQKQRMNSEKGEGGRIWGKENRKGEEKGKEEKQRQIYDVCHCQWCK